jgi:subtilisin family serine protease
MARIYSVLVSAALVAMTLLSPSGDSSSPTLVLAVGVDANTVRSSGTGTSATASAARSTKAQRSHVTRQSVIVTMKEGTGVALNGLRNQKFNSRAGRVSAVYDGLTAHAQQSQRSLHEFLSKAGGSGGSSAFMHAESLWMTNEVVVHGATLALIEQLSKHPHVKNVSPDKIFLLPTPVLSTPATETATFNTMADTTSTTTTTTTAQWGISKINAPSVWTTGNTGKGVVVGVIDTGVRSTHNAIAGSYRSAYGWFDPEKMTSTPYDVNGHGTHVVGTIAGTNGMGVAPGVTWVMCKGCRADGCYASDLTKCFQFMLCPTTPDGATKDCSKAPRIINNSWGGGQGLTTFVDVIAAWRAAGMIPIMAAGNTGTTCGTITTPGDYANVISVGATDVNDNLASFSSKGPTVNGLRKPDISAPGSLILSASYTSDTGVCFKSGTSMATPHVTGAIALLLSAKPTLTFDSVLQLLQSRAITTTLSKSTGFTCGGTLDSTFPNNQYGYGRVDASRLFT